MGRKQGAEGAEVDVEVFQGVAMLGAKIGKAVVEGQESGSEFFFLFVGEIPGIDAAQGLAFDELAHELDQREYELQEVLPDGVRVRRQAVGRTGGPVTRLGGCLDESEGLRQAVADVADPTGPGALRRGALRRGPFLTHGVRRPAPAPG